MVLAPIRSKPFGLAVLRSDGGFSVRPAKRFGADRRPRRSYSSSSDDADDDVNDLERLLLRRVDDGC